MSKGHEHDKSGTGTPPVQTSSARARSSENGAVRRALRGLGFLEGAKSLSPKDGSSKAPPKSGKTLAERKAEFILETHGVSVEGISRGLAATGTGQDREVHAALERLCKDRMVVRQAVLSSMLTRTGRSGGPNLPGKLGGKRTEAMDERADKTAGVVLRGMEKATQDTQKKANPRAPLAHPVSAHGKGSDQISRLLHGRRGDELAHDPTVPTDTMKLSGNEHGLGDVTVPKFGTVGKAPSNTSGAFTSHRGMLHVVTEAFAQAEMVSSFGESERRQKKGEGVVDQGRFVSNVSGPGDELGYNLEVEGFSGQEKGKALQKDEMQRRFERIKRTGGLKHARVVLDPAFVGGKRAGWNLQTAYANSDELSKSYSKPGDVRGGEHDVEARVKHGDKLVKTRESELAKLEKELGGVEKQLVGKKKGVAAKTKQLEALRARSEDVSKVEKGLLGLQKAVAAQEKRVEPLKRQLKDARSALTEAQTALSAAKREQTKLQSARARKEPSGPKAPPAGYDPTTGEYTGGRPEKPGTIPSLKGKDEEGDSLTAHHLYPWNKIEADLNDALRSRSKPKLQRLFEFGEVTLGYDEFWQDLAKDPADRSYLFGEEVNRAAQLICWSPTNVFMGPLGSKRGDDPGEKLDQSYARSGMATPSTALAELFSKKGGIGTSDKLTRLLSRNIRQAQGGQARRYDPTEWKIDSQGKKVRKKRVDL